jgi:DNA-binding beta-propeller fold protein YncE
LLAVANRRSGSITILDAGSGTIRSETIIGDRISDIAALPGSAEILVTDFAAHELILASVRGSSIKALQRLPVARYPVSVAVSPDGESFAVVSLWSRRISLGQIPNEFVESKEASAAGQNGEASFDAKTIDLPFAPRCVVFAKDGSLVISEAFGGRLAIIKPGTVELLVHELPVHNIRDLAIRDDRVWFSHQLLRETARTEAEHIHWGVLLENFVSSLKLDTLHQALDAKQRPLPLEHVRIGDAGDGAGDPSGVAVLSDRLVVTLAGTGQLALIDRVGVRELRLPTGARPVQVICDEVRQRAFVVNALDDSVTFVDLKRGEAERTVSLGPSPEAGPVERGEAAFFDARLSLENWMSCHSCHTDGHTSNRLVDTLGDGHYGNAKRVPTLLGTAKTGPWGWTGSQKTLVGQLEKTLTTTMHASSLPDGVAADLAAYLNSLKPAPSVAAARLKRDETLLIAGKAEFRSAGCVECHAGPQSTTAGVFDVGLEDQLGQRRFNPPSLSGISQRDRLLHDGRARSLDELLDIHPPGITLSKEERRRLIVYLRGL